MFHESILLLHHAMEDSKIKTLRSLCGEAQPIFLDQWRYMQLSQFIRSLRQPIRSLNKSNIIEAIMQNKDPPQHCTVFLNCIKPY